MKFNEDAKYSMNLFLLIAISFLSLIIYCYVAYPIAIWLIAKYFSAPSADCLPQITTMPDVTLLIPGHNIRHLISDKIENISKLRYDGKLRFLFVLDGCDDGSKELLESYCTRNTSRPIEIYANPQRVGKEVAVRNALENVTSKVLVFSDADAFLEPDCLHFLVQALMKNDVGAVSGREIHKKTSSEGASEGQSLFYKYEEFVKINLTKIGSLTYVQGGNFAMLRELYPENIPEGCTQDGIIAFDVVRKGYQVAYEPRAISREEYRLSNTEDFTRRVRTITRAFYSILCRPQVLNPNDTGWYCIHIFSGRVLRWFSMFLGGFAFTFLLASGNEIALILSIAGGATWLALSLLGLITESKKVRVKIPYLAFYLTYIHIAAAIAILHVMLGRKTLTWKPSN